MFNVTLDESIAQGTTTWSCSHWMGIFTQPGLESRGSWDECLRCSPPQEADWVSVSHARLSRRLRNWNRTVPDWLSLFVV